MGFAPIAVNFLLCLLLVWMQTSFEEIVFRGLFLRGACGDLELTAPAIL